MWNQPNQFMRAVNITSDVYGNGIPDYWELQYFGTNGIDPYTLCPSGNGWTILQAYQNGWNPTSFYTPPTPVVSVSPVPTFNGVVVSWQPCPGPVVSYTILRYGQMITNVPATQALVPRMTPRRQWSPQAPLIPP